MNAPTMPPEIQQEAARSLLERLGEKTALVRLFRYNASMKHGVPIDPPPARVISRSDSVKESSTTTTNDQPVQQPIPQPVQQPIPQPVQQPVPVNISVAPAQQIPTQSGGMNDFGKGALLTLAALTGLGGTGYVGYTLANRSPEQIEQVEQVQRESVEPSPWLQSPLQFLEDKGEHLP